MFEKQDVRDYGPLSQKLTTTRRPLEVTIPLHFYYGCPEA